MHFLYMPLPLNIAGSSLRRATLTKLKRHGLSLSLKLYSSTNHGSNAYTSVSTSSLSCGRTKPPSNRSPTTWDLRIPDSLVLDSLVLHWDPRRLSFEKLL